MEQTQTKAHPLQGVLDKNGRAVLVPSVTTDAIAIRPKADGSGDHDILLITRGHPPHKGSLAYPGGFVDYNEDPLVCCLRELEEECGIKGKNPVLITVEGAPGRDPRKHIISIFYKVDVDYNAEPKAGDDAATAQWYDLKDIWNRRSELAFDHGAVLQKLLQKHYPQYL